MLKNLLKWMKWKLRLFARRTARRQYFSRQLTLEFLEDRVAPASFQGLGAPANFPSASQVPGAEHFAEINAISADGTTVVGAVVGDTVGFGARWNVTNDTIEFLNPPGAADGAALGVSNDGSVISVVGGNSLPYRWTEKTGEQPIATIENSYQGLAISGDGNIIAGFLGGAAHQVFRWTAAGSATIVTESDFGVNSYILGVIGMSSDGNVVAGNVTTGGYQRAFRWDNGNLTLVPVDSATFNYGASALSRDGSVMVGNFLNTDGTQIQGFLWTPAGVESIGPVITDSEPPSGPLQDIESLAVSDGGNIIVGWREGFSSSGNQEAAIWDPTRQWRSLQDVLVSQGLGSSLAGWQLTQANAITPDGRTIAGVGIDPQGNQEPWIAHLTDIVVSSVKTTDSRDAIVDYAINNPNLTQPFDIQIFRSDSATYSSDDSNNVAVGQPYPVTNLQQGDYTITIDLSSLAPGEAPSPVEPLAPDPLLPYVLAVVVDAQGNGPTNITVDESQAHFHIYVIADVVPGFGATQPEWVQTMVNDLTAQHYDCVMPFDWDTSAVVPGMAVLGGFQLFEQIVTQSARLAPKLEQDDVIDVHLIGHSRGAAVIGLAMEYLVENRFYYISLALSKTVAASLGEGYYKVTFLDPHPANLATEQDVRVGVTAGGNGVARSFQAALELEAVLDYAEVSTVYSDPSIEVPARVNQAEIFYQQNATTTLSNESILESPWEQYFNLLGDPSQINVLDANKTVTQQYNLSGARLGHSEVWRWYMDNVISTLGIGASPSWPTSSGGSAPVPADLNLVAFLYPEYIDDQSETNALVGYLTMASTDLDGGYYLQAISDLQTFDMAVQAAATMEFVANSADLLVSIGQSLIGDLGATDVANLNSASLKSPNDTVNVQADYPANNQQVSGTLTTGSALSGTGEFSVGNYTQDPVAAPAGQVSQATFDVQTSGLDANTGTSAGVTFTAGVPTQQLQQSTLSYFGNDGQWSTAAFNNGSGWVQVGPSGDTPIQEQDSPVAGSGMSTISLVLNISDDTAPAISGLDGTIFTLAVPAPISLCPLPGGTLGGSYNQTITATGGTGDKTLTVTNVAGSIPGLALPSGGRNTIAISGTPTAVGTLTFTVQAVDTANLTFSQNYALVVTTADPSQSVVSIKPSNLSAGATAVVTLTAIDISGLQETSGGLNAAFAEGRGSGNGTFGAVTDDGDGTYTAIFTAGTAGGNAITATINGQELTTAEAVVTVTPGAVSLPESTVSTSAAALPVGGTATVTLTARDSEGNQENAGGLIVGFSLSAGVGTFSQVQDNGDGIYSATFTGTSPGSDILVATINNQSVTSLPAGMAVLALSPTTSDSLSGTTGSNGWYTSTSLQVTLTATDVTSGVRATYYTIDGGTQQTYSGNPYTVSGEGTHQISFWSVDNAGNTETTESDSFKIDSVAPTTTDDLSGTAGNNGWFTSAAVSVTLSASDATGGVAATYYRVDGGSQQTYANNAFMLSGDGTHQISFWSVDNAGNTETTESDSLKIDSVAPTTTDKLSGTTGNNNWYRSTVAVTLMPTDATSGVAATYYSLDSGSAQTYTGTFLVSTDGIHVLHYHSVDRAGNLEQTEGQTIQIDTTAPMLMLPANQIFEPTQLGGARVNYVGATATDNLTTPALTYSQAPGTVFPLGVTTVQVTATDAAGNQSHGSLTITVKPVAETLALHAPTSVYVGARFAIAVVAEDHFGNVDTSFAGQVDVGQTPGALTTSQASAQNGKATFANLSMHVAGTYTLLAQSTGDLVAATAPLRVLPAPKFKVALTPKTPGQTAAGQIFNVMVTAQLNDRIDGAYDGTIHLASSDLHAVLLADQALANGTGLFEVTLNTPGKQTVTVTDDSLAALKGTSNSVTVTGASPVGIDHFKVTGFPTLNVIGVAHTATVTAVDVYGKAVTNYTGSVQMTSTLPGLKAGPVKFTKGVAKISVDLRTLGIQSVIATDGNGRTGAETNIDVVSPATHLGITVQTSEGSTTSEVTAGEQVTVTVKALTGSKEVDALFTDTLQLVPSDPRALVAAQPMADGIETFTVTFFTAGSQTITVSDLTRPSIARVKAAVTVNPAAVFQLSVSGYPLFAVAGAAHSFTVTAEDPYGNQETSCTDSMDVAGKAYKLNRGTGVFTTAFATTGAATLTATDASNPKVQAGAEGNITEVNAEVALTVDPGNSADSALVIIAPSYDGTIIITPANAAGTLVAVSINGKAQSVPTPSSPLGQIIVYGQSGSDVVKEMSVVMQGQPAFVGIPTLILGGSGSDTLSAAGSNADNILVGGHGKNNLTGGKGSDMLVSGSGGGTLKAGTGNDILISGSTIYDANPAVLLSLLAQWTQAPSYGHGVDALFGGLLAPADMLPASAVSYLIGTTGAGQDWFWLKPGDKLSNYASGEVATLE